MKEEEGKQKDGDKNKNPHCWQWCRTGNCSSGHPYNHFAVFFFLQKRQNCTESVCAEPLFVIPACETKICAKNSYISRLWLVEIGDRVALVDGSITQSNKIIQLSTRSPSSLQDHPAHYKITELTTRSPSSLQEPSTTSLNSAQLLSSVYRWPCRLSFVFHKWREAGLKFTD